MRRAGGADGTVAGTWLPEASTFPTNGLTMTDTVDHASRMRTASGMWSESDRSDESARTRWQMTRND